MGFRDTGYRRVLAGSPPCLERSSHFSKLRLYICLMNFAGVKSLCVQKHLLPLQGFCPVWLRRPKPEENLEVPRVLKFHSTRKNLDFSRTGLARY